MARAAIERPTDRTVLSVDLTTIGLVADGVDVDLDALERGLRAGIDCPVDERIGRLAPLVDDRRVLLEDDPFEDWAVAARERLSELPGGGRRLARARPGHHGRTRAGPLPPVAIRDRR